MYNARISKYNTEHYMRLILLFAIFRFDNKLLVDTKLDNALKAATQSRRFYFIKCNPYAPREDQQKKK